MPLSDYWQWRAADLIGNDNSKYKLLVMYRMDDKLNYKAWLSKDMNGKESALISRYEYHGSHGGLHCHLLCYSEHYPVGEIEPMGLVSFPHYKNNNRQPLGLMSLNTAWNFALKFYRIGEGKQEGGLI